MRSAATLAACILAVLGVRRLLRDAAPITPEEWRRNGAM